MTWALQEGDASRFIREYMTDWKPYSWTDEDLDKLARELPDAPGYRSSTIKQDLKNRFLSTSRWRNPAGRAAGTVL